MSDRPPVAEHPGHGPLLSSYVAHDVGERRLERQWAAVSARLGGRRARWPLALYAAAAVVAVLVALHFGLRPGAGAASLEGATLEGLGAGQVITLPDGAEVRLAARTLLRVSTWTERRVVLVVERGEATFDVPHREGRAWVIAAGEFDVRVVGTRFVVKRELGVEGEAVSVDVLRGRVEIVRRDAPDAPRVLAAGESWRRGGVPGATSGTPPSEEPDAAALALPTPAVSASAAEPLAAPSVAPSLSWEDLARARRYKDAYDALGPDGFAREMGSANAETLFRLAEIARSSGHLRDADRAFDRLRRQFRGDSRAGLAAFELGRLRLDSLHDPAGAAAALADAVALAPGASFREDAEARRVQALDGRASIPACESARDAYLARYPSGAHAAVVRSRCQPR